MASASFQYKIYGYRIDTLWLVAWGEAQGLATLEDFDSLTEENNAFERTTTALEKAIFACGVQAHKGGILPIGPEDADERDLCVYVATNMYPEDEKLPDEDTMIKVKELLGRKMDEEPQWYESTTAIKFGNGRWCSRGGTEENLGSATNPGQYKICGYLIDTLWLVAWGEAQGLATLEDFDSEGSSAFERTTTALEKAIFAYGVQAYKGGIRPIGPEDADERDLGPTYATLPDEDTMIKVKELLGRKMDEEPQWYESTTAIKFGN
ncbi:hypothetical protein DFH11DRAFT_1747720 [Phellopilus nigrolimitatus]|nr:hypothetical protein DFH11DRAFT_1747720 [Phellopilus nigrolimitatus]